MEHPDPRRDERHDYGATGRPQGQAPPPGAGTETHHAGEHSSTRTGDRPIGSLLTELVREMRQLVRKESHLARSEIREKLSQAGSGAGALGTGALTAFAGLLFLLQAATLALDLWVREPWLSALIVGGVVTLTGLILLAKGRSNLKTENLAPERTTRSLQRDRELAQQEMGRSR